MVNKFRTGFANVIFNVFITNPNSMSQIDSLDLIEPTLDKYLSSIQSFYSDMAVNELQIISPSAIIINPSTSPSLPKTTAPLSLSTNNPNENNTNKNSQEEGGLVI